MALLSRSGAVAFRQYRSLHFSGAGIFEPLIDRKQQAKELFEELPRRYDELGAALSFWQDPRWRRAMVGEVRAAPGERMLDVASGTGLVAEALVRRYGCTVVGLDQSVAMLGRARQKLR